MMPLYVNVVSFLIARYPLPESTRIPRFAFNVNEAFVRSVPPLNTRWPAVGDPGGTPSPLSALMDTVPALIVVEPVNVFTAGRYSVPVPLFVRVPDPVAIGSRIEKLPDPSKVRFVFVPEIPEPEATSTINSPASLWNSVAPDNVSWALTVLVPDVLRMAPTLP